MATSRFSTEQQAQYRNDAKAAGADDAYMDDFLARNPDDYNRLASSYAPTSPPSGNKDQFAQSWSTPGGMGGSMTGGSNWSMPGSPVQDDAQKAKGNELYGLLKNRATQGLNVDRNDPAVRAQADAYAANEERVRRDTVSDGAEAGGPLANNAGTARMAAERSAQRTGTFEAELVGRELKSKRDEIAQALTGMQGMLSEDQRNELTMQLAQMDNALRKYGIDTQKSTADAGRDLDWQRTLMQNDQFTRDLGLRAEDRASYYDLVRRGQLG